MNDKQTTDKVYCNALADEKSPYLLQHAHNPVNWYPWGDEAFEKARLEDKPIFLSIGYATCHWCHVMAHESFEDNEVADLLNRDFVAVKLDREERPDVDHFYMTVCLLLTGSGGWPLTIVTTPDKKPFFAATYIPKHSQFGNKGMVEVLPQVASWYRSNRNAVLQRAHAIEQRVARGESRTGGSPPAGDVANAGFDQLVSMYDKKHGGFGTGTKFPTPHNLIFLLRYWKQTGNPEALAMVENTLVAMRNGGVYDHLGGGFHRYSTEPTWTVPHFEKMLYDQALLMWAYAEAYSATRNPFYKQVAREILSYVSEMLTAEDGSFLSAEDADSEGAEGTFYLWKKEEIETALPSDLAAAIVSKYGVTKKGNFVDPHSGSRASILTRNGSGDWKVPEGISVLALKQAEKQLKELRAKRPRPALDDKELTDWNGLMIGACAIAGRLLKEDVFTETAEKAAAAVLKKMRLLDGRLQHRYRDGHTAIDGMLDDYAFMIFGLIELHQTTFHLSYLGEAVSLSTTVLEQFHDPGDGAFFETSKNNRELPIPVKNLYDGAIPSGNATMMYNLIRLSRLTGISRFEDRASALSGEFEKELLSAPSGHSMFLIAWIAATAASAEVVLTGARKDAFQPFVDALSDVYIPSLVTLIKYPGNASALETLAPFTRHLEISKIDTTAHVCVRHSCTFPVTKPLEMIGLIEKARTP